MPWLLLAATFAAVAPRLTFVWAAPAMEGDGQVYATVALNILHNGCVSLSDPALGGCAPHWGGNQLPGYPAFIALSWLLTGEWVLAPLVAQSLVFGVATAYVVRALLLAGSSLRVAVLAAAVLALSPTLAAWPRMLLTETLAVAAALWLLAALIRSIAEGRIRTIELGLAFAVGFFIRYDFALLAVPAALAGLYLHRPAEAIRRGTAIALIVAIPFGAWTLRSVAAGLPPLPPFGLTSAGEPLAPGVLRWMGTWVVSPYDLPNSVWPFVTGDYQNIQPPDRAFADPDEQKAAAELLDQLAQSGAGPVPPDIDAAFYRLAEARLRDAPIRQRVGLPLRRAAEMWLSPLPSMGWPGEVGAGRSALLEAAKAGNARQFIQFAWENAGPATAKGLVAAWRYTILAGLAVLLVLNALGRRRDGVLLWTVVAFALVRTSVFASTILVEARYLLPALAWLEVMLVVSLARGTQKSD